MTPFHLFMFAVVDIYGKPDTSFHLPWFVKFSLIGLGIRAFVWVLNELPKQNKSLQKPTRESSDTSHVPNLAAPISYEPLVASDILVLKDGQQLGPYPVEEINRQLSAHTFDASDFAWHEGLAEWQPLSSIAGVVSGHAHHLRPPPPPVQNTGWSSPSTDNSSTPSSGGLQIGGYVCAAVSLLFLPPVLGLAGIICGVVLVKRQHANQGFVLLIVSFVCAVIGMIIGANS